MDAGVSSGGSSVAGSCVSLATLARGARGAIVRVGAAHGSLTALERRLLELGFVPGEEIEILAEARPGRDPFVVRVGHTTLALRRREARDVWVEPQGAGTARRQSRHAAAVAQP